MSRSKSKQHKYQKKNVFKFATTGLSNLDKQWSKAHFVSFLFHCYCNTRIKYPWVFFEKVNSSFWNSNRDSLVQSGTRDISSLPRPIVVSQQPSPEPAWTPLVPFPLAPALGGGPAPIMMVTASEVGHKNQPLLAYTAQPPATMIRKRLASAGHVACAASKEAIDAHYASSSSLSRSSLSLSTPLPSPVPTASSAHHSHTSSQFSVPTDVEL